MRKQAYSVKIGPIEDILTSSCCLFDICRDAQGKFIYNYVNITRK